MKFIPSITGVRVIAAACLIQFVVGCSTTDLRKPLPDYVPQNFTGVAGLPSNIRRVVLLPISGSTVASTESVAQLDPVFLTALSQQQRFEVVTLTRSDCRRRYGADTFNSTEALPNGLLKRIADDFSADALIFIDMTSYQAYRPIEFGIRSKLIELKNRENLWSFDEVFSLADPVIEASAQRFARPPRSSSPVDLSGNLTQSPAAFARYVAHTVFSTLPPR